MDLSSSGGREGGAAEGPAAVEDVLGAGSAGGDATSWVGAVAVCKGSDLVVSGELAGMRVSWEMRGRLGSECECGHEHAASLKVSICSSFCARPLPPSRPLLHACTAA